MYNVSRHLSFQHHVPLGAIVLLIKFEVVSSQNVMIFWSTKNLKRSCHALLEKLYPSLFHIIYRKLLNEISFECQYSRMPGNFKRCVLFGIFCPQIPLVVLSCGQEKLTQDNPSHKGRDSHVLGAGWTPRQYRKPWVSSLVSFSPPAETIHNWRIWPEQAGFMPSGQRWPGLEGKLSHLSTYVKDLGCIIHSSPLSIQQNLQLRPRLYTSF